MDSQNASAMDVSQLLDLLEGSWTINRHIEQERATMQGSARFTRHAEDALLYDEEGLLTLRSGQRFRCTRRYRFLAQGDLLQIRFDDGPDSGKVFVQLRFGGEASGVLSAVDQHYCGPDIYSVHYRLHLPESYETDVFVSGPKKHYRALTRYTKIVC